MARATSIPTGPINPQTTSGTQLAALLSARENAENTGHAGTGRPSYAQAGMIYTDDSGLTAKLFLAVGPGPTNINDVDLSQLFATRPGTLSVTSEVRLPPIAGSVYPWLWADGQAWPRVSYPALFDAICPTFTGTVTAGSINITGVAFVPADDPMKLGLIGAKIEGSGIPTGATIATIPSTSTMTLSVAAAAPGGVNTPLRAFPHGNGNGSTTFNVPNCKDRVVIGRGNMNSVLGAGFITVAGSGIDSTKLGAVGGVQSVVLLTTHLPAHIHTASGGSTFVSGSTGNENANHTHLVDGQSGGQSQDHYHAYTTWNQNAKAEPSGGSSGNTAFAAASTGALLNGVYGDHSHKVSIMSGVQSGSFHGHAITSLVLNIGVTVNPSTGGDNAHNNTQPSIIQNVVIKT